MLIKLCGFCQLKDVDLAIEAGADFLGLIFAESSPRKISTDTAKLMARYARGKIQVVGVFQNQSQADIVEVAKSVGLDWVQLHGQESPAECQALPWPIIKAFEVDHDFDWSQIKAYPARVRYALLDRSKNSFISVDSWHQQVAEGLQTYSQLTRPVFLAGGLTPANVATQLARHITEVAGVDIASGIEAAIGVKDPDLLSRFCNAVRHYK